MPKTALAHRQTWGRATPTTLSSRPIWIRLCEPTEPSGTEADATRSTNAGYGVNTAAHLGAIYATVSPSGDAPAAVHDVH